MYTSSFAAAGESASGFHAILLTPTALRRPYRSCVFFLFCSATPLLRYFGRLLAQSTVGVVEKMYGYLGFFSRITKGRSKSMRQAPCMGDIRVLQPL